MCDCPGNHWTNLLNFIVDNNWTLNNLDFCCANPQQLRCSPWDEPSEGALCYTNALCSPSLTLARTEFPPGKFRVRLNGSESTFLTFARTKIILRIPVLTNSRTKYQNISMRRENFQRTGFLLIARHAKLSWMKIAFIITRKRNNVVVSFGTLKVQSFMLTKVRDCDLLIFVTSSTFLKRKDILKEKRQLAQIIKARSPAYI